MAAARARANTAKLLAESPVLMRLRELETLEKVAEGAGNTVLVALPGESRVSGQRLNQSLTWQVARRGSSNSPAGRGLKRSASGD